MYVAVLQSMIECKGRDNIESEKEERGNEWNRWVQSMWLAWIHG